MTIEENLELLQNTKEAIYSAIESMGGEISSATPFSGYADAIMTIPQDGGDEPCDPCDDTSECYDQLECDCSNDYCSDPECPGYDPMECDPCMADPCSDPECGAYDPVACGECEDNPCASPGCVEYDECRCEELPSGVQGFNLTQGEQLRIYFGPFDPAGDRYQSRTVKALYYCDCSDQQVESSWEVEYDTNDNLAGVSPASNDLAYVANSVYEGVYDENDPSNNEDGHIDVEALTDGWWFFCADGIDISYVEKIDGEGE